MKKLLLVHNLKTRFVAIDAELLAQTFAVEECDLKTNRLNPWRIFRQVHRNELVVGWFASWHTLLPMLFARLLRRPSLMIIGGYDLANMPEIGYGLQRGGLKKWVSRLVMRLAKRLMTNSEYSRGEAETNAGLKPDHVNVVYHGVPDFFGSLPEKEGRPLVLTVGNVDRANLFRKGHEPFVRAAAAFPDVEFALVGAWRDDAVEYLRSIATPNVTFPGRVDDETLNAFYRRARVYVQASAHEGFGMSLAESMLAGAVPVVSRAGAIPEVVGAEGYYIDSIDTEPLVDAIRKALAEKPEAGGRARQRIVTEFSLEKRARGMRNLLQF